MSSSVFIENVSNPIKGGIEKENEASISGSPNSNLVVVYGKSGVNFDQRGIENLIEEKTLSSISVIRLTSPTPSMMDEEQEAEKADELLRRQAEGLSDDDSNESSNENRSTADDCEECSESEEMQTADDDKSNDDEILADNRKTKGKNKRKCRSSAKTQNIHSKPNTERPDIVGLTIEEFYPTATAKEVVKEALKLAGLSTIKHTADYEFQLLVIKNDHCYTPFTSPAQMKTKLAEKYKAEGHSITGRKLIPHTAITIKQIQMKKKGSQNIEGSTDQSVDQHLKEANKNSEMYEKNCMGEIMEDDVSVFSSPAESDLDIMTEESGDTDNDRDSDLDFDVNNRKGRKKKDLVTKAKRLSASKVHVKRHLQTHEDIEEHRNKLSRPVVSSFANRTNKVGITPKVAGAAPIAVQKLLSDAVAALPPIPKRSVTTKMEEKRINPLPRQHTVTNAIRRGPIIEVGVQKTQSSRAKLQSSPHSVKEIALNKMMASPKGGFTEISQLLSQTEQKTPTKAAPNTPTVSLKAPGPNSIVSPSPSKGFMPLVIETAAKNKLPAQISIQTHQSSSELAAKNKVSLEIQRTIQTDNMSANNSRMHAQSTSDLAAEQFDLIVSIVKDEMQKTESLKGISKSHDNIPKIVKMLESAEQTLESNNTQLQIKKNLVNFGSSADSTVDDIDISNAPLLETPEGGEIPEDLLQHVVDLIEDDETLQDAVESQVFSDNNCETILYAKHTEGKAMSTSSPMSILPPLSQRHSAESESNQPKSIIEMAISNLPSTLITEGNVTNRITGTLPSKGSPLIRKEPIQIVRGNGRVITLPPIEAPTTRAKRRAQNQPVSNSSTIFNESSIDSSFQSNSSFTILEPGPPITVSAENKKEPSNKRRVSKESTTTGATTKGKRSTTKRGTTAKASVNKAAPEDEASGSQEDDDDPNKLWCICRQPHNNRFMICCDVCEDWFHGTCVSITKAMGIEMEQKGIDWTCPKCVKLQDEKTQRKITDMLLPKKLASNTSAERNDKISYGKINIVATDSNLNKVESATGLSNDKNPMQKSDWVNINQPTEINQFQPEQITAQLRKSFEATKNVSGSQKKKTQSVNSKNKPASIVSSQTKRRVPAMQQEPKIQVDSIKQATPSHPIYGSQQTIKNLQKSPASAATLGDQYSLCIVCKKKARANSIYCSDDCIRKHAQNALNLFAAASTSKPPEPTIVVAINEENAIKKKKPKGLFEDLLSMADRKPKIERVNVIERKTGRVLTGSNAPTTLNLKKWLQDNQTFEVVQPGSFQAQEIEKKQKQRGSQSLSPVISSESKYLIQPPPNMQTTSQALNSTPVNKPTNHSHRESESNPQVQRQTKQVVEQIVKTASNSPRPGTPKILQKNSHQGSNKPDKVTRNDSKEEAKDKKEKPSKQRSTPDSAAKKNPEPGTSASSNSEPIRLNVRRTLKEQLLQRMNELGSDSKSGNNFSKLTIEETEQFALETEAEMYECFSRDTGSRYRAKYRSLMFNIKDRKNHTLFAKICAKKIQPNQLVRMSPEELASQELAKWRENEAKHQLDMIKKSELDLLSCTKNYVLKTHKGEEVIEGKQQICVNLDVTIPVEDVVSVLNSSVVSSSNIVEAKVKNDIRTNSDPQQNSENVDIQPSKITNRSDEEKQKNCLREKERDLERNCERDRNRDQVRDCEHSHTRARSHDSDRSREKHKRGKEKDRHSDKSRCRKRSRSYSRSRSRSREKRHKSHHKDEKREKEERDRERERDRFKDKEKVRDRDRETRSLKDESDKKIAEANIPELNKSHTIITSKDKNSLKKPGSTKPIETYSLIDQILESTKTVEEAANLLGEKEKEKQKKDASGQVVTRPLPTSSVNKSESQQNRSTSSIYSNEDQEPSSTVSITTPPQDPYIRYADVDSPPLGGNITSSDIWSGSINMVDVASFQMVLQPVIGNSLNMGALLPDELDVVGRIGPDTVWEYISKIKRSPNKEIIIIRLIPASESETAAYTVLFQYLENRNRLGVISTSSPQIKDFYIYPWGAGKPMPPVLMPLEKVDFYEDPYRPDILMGVVVRIIGKRHSTVATISATSSIPKSYRRGTDTGTFTPPGSPKRKRRIHASTPKVDEIDLDAIIKAPITTKAHKTSTISLTTVNDADEPYSPGGSSDDDAILISQTTSRSDDSELKRKMDELNRQIAAQEKEIAGLLNVESTCFATTSSSKTSAVLANISIPSNLSQILASIKNKPEGNHAQSSTTAVEAHQSVIHATIKNHSNITEDDHYDPEGSLFGTNAKASSRLAQLSEAELLSMVPDGMIDIPSVQKSMETKTHFEEPPPPGV